MKFSEIEYKRPDFEKAGKDLYELSLQLENKSFDEQVKIIIKSREIISDISSYSSLASIRNSIDTKDEFYEEEMKFISMESPKLDEHITNFNRSIIKNCNKKLLDKKFGSVFYKQLENSLKLFNNDIIEDLQQESLLVLDYEKIIAGARINFNDEVYNLSKMYSFLSDKDSKIRKEAYFKIQEFFKDNEKEIDSIYDKLVKIRINISKKLGFKSYIDYRYLALGRFDYDKNDMKQYRENIIKYIVPFCLELNKRRANKLGISSLKTYDGSIEFLSGNPKPIGEENELVEKALKMYKQMSPETGEFFQMLKDRELLSLTALPNKRTGGYCTYLEKFKAPFIFANFNKTAGDVDVLTHEAGHAFQSYTSRFLLSDLIWPSLEACEIHSMSMEFFAWPYMKEFFGDDYLKYYFTHLKSAFTFLPYGALIDHFQEQVYENPELNPDERKSLYRRLEKIYLPDKDYGEDAFGEKGVFWYKQGHLFAEPFYYIDYTLAQACAFQFWALDRENHQKAWEKYYKLCTLGGSKSFLGLLKNVKLIIPFKGNNLKKIVTPIIEYLKNTDDSKF